LRPCICIPGISYDVFNNEGPVRDTNGPFTINITDQQLKEPAGLYYTGVRNAFLGTSLVDRAAFYVSAIITTLKGSSGLGTSDVLTYSTCIRMPYG